MEYNNDVIRSKYQLVPRSLIFICKDDEILFIHKDKKDSFGYAKLNGIGGHIEKGEEPFQAAKREVLEESGLIIDSLELAAIVFIEIGINPGILLFVFYCEYPGGSLKESEEGRLIWLRENEVSNHENMVKDVPFLLELIKNHEQGYPPKFVKYLYDESGELRIVM